MTLSPAGIEQLKESLPKASGVESVDLSAIDQLVEHVPEDMTATVQAGMTVADFQTALAQHGQWLPIDPSGPQATSIGALLAGDANGPRRFGFGTIRDWLIGIAVVLPDGRLVRNGGKVVKNVAGFDLCKLFVGSRGTLGVIVEATFKLLPRAEKEVFLSGECSTLDEAEELIGEIWQSETQPHALDLHRLDGQPIMLVVGFAGAAADVDSQIDQASHLGITTETQLDYDGQFRAQARATESVSPGSLIEKLRSMDTFVARAGNGVIYHPGERPPHKPTALELRIKEAFDPNGILPAS